MMRLAKFILLVGVLSGVILVAQDSKYQPTELQTLRLQVKQRDAQIAQKDLFIAQQNFQVALATLKAEGDRVKQENKWDAGVIFNPETIAFIAPPKPISAITSEAVK